MRRVAAVLAVALALSACTPATEPQGEGRAPAEGPTAEASPLARTAWEAWHLMEIGHLRTGVYATNVLVDLDLPQGVRWTVVEFADDAYLLRVSAEEEEDAYLVEPSGVRPAG